MKKTYQTPEMDIELLDLMDIIVTSGRGSFSTTSSDHVDNGFSDVPSSDSDTPAADLTPASDIPAGSGEIG